MKKVIHKSASRGSADHGWLKTHHSFSFANYYDPSRMHFGMLRVLNDDYVAPSKGFGLHPHDNMEIVTIPVKGTLNHRDTTGRSEALRAGDVQIMSAGTGLQHAEFNESKEEAVELFQVWVMPKVENITPRYDQRTFSVSDRKNKLQIVVSPDEKDNALWINQDAYFTLSDVDAGKEVEYTIHKKGNGVYVFMIEGKAKVADEILDRRDAMGVSETDTFKVLPQTPARLLFIEVPMN